MGVGIKIGRRAEFDHVAAVNAGCVSVYAAWDVKIRGPTKAEAMSSVVAEDQREPYEYEHSVENPHELIKPSEKVVGILNHRSVPSP